MPSSLYLSVGARARLLKGRRAAQWPSSGCVVDYFTLCILWRGRQRGCVCQRSLSAPKTRVRWQLERQRWRWCGDWLSAGLRIVPAHGFWCALGLCSLLVTAFGRGVSIVVGLDRRCPR